MHPKQEKSSAIRCRNYRRAFLFCDIVCYFVLFRSPLTDLLLPQRHVKLECTYLLVGAILDLLLVFFLNRRAKKRGEDLPYPDFPYWF